MRLPNEFGWCGEQTAASFAEARVDNGGGV